MIDYDEMMIAKMKYFDALDAADAIYVKKIADIAQRYFDKKLTMAEYLAEDYQAQGEKEVAYNEARPLRFLWMAYLKKVGA